MTDRLVPNGWTTARVGDVATYVNGLAFKPRDWTEDGTPIIRIQNLTDPTKEYNKTTRTVPDSLVVRSGDILVSWSATLDAFFWKGPDAVLNQHIFRVIPRYEVVHKRYLFWALKQVIQEMWASEHTHGSTMRHINRGPFLAHPFPLAPLAEQDRIVAEIEKQFTRLDAGVDELGRVKSKLKRYRASILKAACEGTLVPAEAEIARKERREYEPANTLLERILNERRTKWEHDQLAKMIAVGKKPKDVTWKARYKEPAKASTAELGPLPVGWVWASLDALSTKITDGVHKKPEYVTEGVPFVTVRNLTAGPGIDFENLKYVSEMDHAEFTKRTKPELGDLLISKDGTLGVVRLVRTSRAFSIFVSVALMKPIMRGMGPYLEVALRSPQVQRQMVPKGTGLVHLHLEDLREDCVPLPPFSEQLRIADNVAAQMSVVETMEKLVFDAIRRIALLRAAILQHAFKGRLVAQDPADEPAAALLERVGPTEARLVKRTMRKSRLKGTAAASRKRTRS